MNKRSFALAGLLLAGACSDQVFTIDVPLRVTSVSPSPGAAGVDRGSSIVVTFSEDVVPESATTQDAIKIERIGADGNGVAVAGTYTYGQSGAAPFAVTFKPKAAGSDARALPYAAKFRVTLATTITRKRDGGVLPTPVSFEFSTQAPPPLGVVRMTPSDGVVNFGRQGAVSITFTEPVDCAAFPIAENAEGIVTFTESHDAHPHWKGASTDAVKVPGKWVCPVFPEGDRFVKEGSCKASDAADTKDYCTVTFRYGAQDTTDAGLKLTRQLSPSSAFTITLPGADKGTDPATVVHSLRATRAKDSEGKDLLFGALGTTVTTTGTVQAPPPLQLIVTAPRQGEIVGGGAARSATITLQFSEKVECASLEGGVTVEETLDPAVATKLGVASGKRTVAGDWSCHTITSKREEFACTGGDCTYTFTPRPAAGEATPFAFSSTVAVKLAGGDYATATAKPESVRATTTAGRLPADASFEFRIADPSTFVLAAATPSALATNVARDAAIALTFSEPVDCALLSGVTVRETFDSTVAGGTVTVPGAWTCAAPVADTTANPDASKSCEGGHCTATFVPTARFKPSSSVEVKLPGLPAASGKTVLQSARATGHAGQLPSDLTWSFRVEDPPALAITTTSPSNGSAGVELNAKIRVAFSEPPNCTKLQALTKVVERKVGASADTTVAGAWTCTSAPAETPENVATAYSCDDSNAFCVAEFTPAADFSYSTKVTVTLPGGGTLTDSLSSSRATSRGGKLLAPVTVAFRVIDPPPLGLVSSTPGAGSSGVDASVDVSLRFSEPPDCSTIVLCTDSNDSSCTLKVTEIADPFIGNTAVGNESARLKTLRSGTLTCSATSSDVTLALADFAASSDVEVLLKGGVNGPAIATTRGGRLSSATTIRFTVKAPPVLVLESALPGTGSTGISPTGPVVLTFSENLLCSSVVAGTNFIAERRTPELAAGTAQGTFTALTGAPACSGKTLTYTPSATLTPSSDLRLTLGTASVGTTLRSAAGTTKGGTFDGPLQFTFRVADPAPLTVLAISPSGNPAVGVDASSDIRVTFDRAIRCATIASRLKLFEGTNPVTGVVTCSDGTTTGPTVEGALAIFVPGALLKLDSTHKIVVEAGVEEAKATKVGSTIYGRLPSNIETTFRATTDALRVITTTPAGASTAVPVGTGLSIKFNQDIQPSSIVPCLAAATNAPCNLFVSPASSPAISSAIKTTFVAYDPVTFTATYDLEDGSSAPDLQPAKAYVAKLLSGTAGPKGQNDISRLAVDFSWTFTTAANPVVLAVTPADSATGVSVAAPICIDFSGQVTASSLTGGGNQITLTWVDQFGRTATAALDGSNPYAITSSLGRTSNRVCLTLALATLEGLPGTRRLLHSVTYSVRISTSVVVAGAVLASPFVSTFATASPPQLGGVRVRNAVINDAVTNGLDEIPTNGVFTISFTGAMKPGSLSSTNIALVNATDVPVASSLALDDSTNPRSITITPAAPLVAATPYTVRIYGGAGGAIPQNDEYLANDIRIDFTTSPVTTLKEAALGTAVNPVSMLSVISDRDLYLPSASSDTAFALNGTTKLPGIVAIQLKQPRAVTVVPLPTWPTTGGSALKLQTTTALLDYRGNAVPAYATSVAYGPGSTPALNSQIPDTATFTEVAPTQGATATPTPENFTWIFTPKGVAYKDRMIATGYFSTTNAADGAITPVVLEAQGGTGCPNSGVLLPLRVELVPSASAAANDTVKITAIGPTWPKGGCNYNLKIRQGLTANLLDLAPVTTGCTATPPTTVISKDACASSVEPGLKFVGETSVPTLVSAKVRKLADFTQATTTTTATDTIGIWGGTEIVLEFNEPVDETTINSTNVKLKTGTTTLATTYTVSGAIVTMRAQATKLIANTDYTIDLSGVKDRAGNTLVSLTRLFKTENTATTNTVTATFSATPTRTAPFGTASITLSEPPDPASVSVNTQSALGSLSVRNGSTKLFGLATTSVSNPPDLAKRRVITWTPTEALTSGITVTVEVNPSAVSTKLQDQTGTDFPNATATFVVP